MNDNEKIVRNMIGGIWKVESIEDEPSITLKGCIIYEVSSHLYPEAGRTRHFSGYSVHGYEGRASTPIIEFDPITKTGRTLNGRVYKILDQKPRFSEAGDRDHVWSYMVRRDEMYDIVDVTDECLAAPE